MNNESSAIKKVLSNSGIYSIVSILQKAIGFFLLPLYTIYLTPEDYGITGLVISITTMLSLLFTLSLNGAANRFYFDYKDNPKSLRDFLGTIVSFILVNSIIMSFLIILFNKQLFTPFVKGIEFYPYILIGVLTVLFTPVYTIYQNILQTMQEAGNYAVNSIINFCFLLGTNILLIVVLKLGALGQLLSYLITGIIFAVYSVYKLLKRKLISFTIKKTYLYESLRYSIPLLPHLLSTTIANFASRIFLNNQSSTVDLGLFNVGSQFLIIIDTIQMSANNAYIPWFYDLMGKGKSTHDNIITFADFLLKANCVLSLAMILFIKEVIQVMINPTFWLAWTVVPIMVIAYQIRGIYLFYVNTLFYNKRATKFIFIATLSGNLISVTLSALLTEKLGIMTPAIVLLVEKTITTIIVVYISRKIEPISFKLGKMTGYVVLLVFTSLIGLLFDLNDPVGNLNYLIIIYKLIIFIVITYIIIKPDYKLMLNSLHQIFHKK